ncbi:MAG: threonine synthase [Dehalococcoidia bacterium]|nr:threonine synthase [Dehalococcoidia bacterium]
MGQGVLTHYAEFLPLTPATPRITLGEGETPLVRSRHIERETGGEVYFKLEGCNPTGSFKDRGMVVAVAKALEEDSKALICASTGNTSASAAAFGACCGLKVIVLVPQGSIALGKLAQALIYGAQVIAIEGSFDRDMEIARGLADRHPFTLVNSLNPYRLEGQKTAAFEVIEALGDAPDYLFIPVGNAGNITAYWRGFQEFHSREKSSQTPRMMGFQAEGSAPIVRGEPVADPRTVASAIRIGNPAHWQNAVTAGKESGGGVEAVSDDEILEAYRLLANTEGVFGEPASAASVAGLLKSTRQGLSLEGKRIVCVITGNGLKDPDTAMSQAPEPTVFPPDLEQIEKAIIGAPGSSSWTRP